MEAMVLQGGADRSGAEAAEGGAGGGPVPGRGPSLPQNAGAPEEHCPGNNSNHINSSAGF